MEKIFSWLKQISKEYYLPCLHVSAFLLIISYLKILFFMLPDKDYFIVVLAQTVMLIGIWGVRELKGFPTFEEKGTLLRLMAWALAFSVLMLAIGIMRNLIWRW